MVNMFTKWGGGAIKLTSPLAISRFTRIQAYGGGKGPGMHWIPVAGRAGLVGGGYGTIGVVGGPGLPATGFVDIAINQATEDLKGDLQVANDKLAVLAEDYCNRGTYLTTHKMKTEKAKGIYGDNLWKEVNDYPPSPSGGAKYGKFRVTETAAMKELSRDLGAGLTPADIGKISKLPPLVQKYDAGDIMGGTMPDPEYGFKKGGYTFFRSAPVSTSSMHEVDVAVLDSSGRWKGFAEFGVSDFRGEGIDMDKIGAKWTIGDVGEVKGGRPGRALYIHRGQSLINYYADENMSEGLRATAFQADMYYRRAMLQYRQKVKDYSAVNFNTMVRGRAQTRYGKWGFRGKANTFNAHQHIGVSLTAPERAASRRKEQFYLVNVVYYHPVATAWNYGLIPGEGFFSIERGQRTTQAWRLAPIREKTIGFTGVG